MTQNARKTGQVATVTLFGLFTRLLGFLFKIYSSKKLGAEAIGNFQIALSVFFLFNSVACTGIPVVLNRRTAERDAGDYRTFTTAFVWSSGIALGLCVLLFVFGNKLGFLFSDRSALPTFLYMIPALLSSAMYCTVRGFLWGKKKFTAFSLTETGEETLRIVLSVLFISGLFGTFSGVQSLSYGFVLSDILATAVILILFFGKGATLQKPAPSAEIMLPALPVTAMHLTSSLFGTALAVLLPVLLQKYGLSVQESTACFGRVAGMANPLLFASGTVTGSIVVVMLPDVSRMAKERDFASLNERLLHELRFCVLVAGLFSAVYLACGERLTTAVFGDGESGKYLSVASLAIIPMTLAQMTQSVLNAIGREKNGFINYLLGNALLLLCVFLLTPKIGIYAVAVGSVCGNGVIFLCNFAVLRKRTGFSPSIFLYQGIACGFSIVCASFSRSFGTLIENHPIASLLCAMSFATAVYLVLCFVAFPSDMRRVWEKCLCKVKRKSRKSA